MSLKRQGRNPTRITVQIFSTLSVLSALNQICSTFPSIYLLSTFQIVFYIPLNVLYHGSLTQTYACMKNLDHKSCRIGTSDAQKGIVAVCESSLLLLMIVDAPRFLTAKTRFVEWYPSVDPEHKQIGIDVIRLRAETKVSGNLSCYANLG